MNEKIARVLVSLFFVGGALAIGLGWWQSNAKTITVHARMPENGGWDPIDLTTEVGQPLHLRVTSDDVMHGFAVGQNILAPVDIKPGQFTDITLIFDKPGTYTFYCTRWCGANHWRMRGTVTVTGEPVDETYAQPLYLQLGLDIDAVHQAENIPNEKPSTMRAAGLGLDLSAYEGTDYYRSHSPEQIWLELGNDPETATLSNQERWDVVALIWQKNTTSAELAESTQLYAENCAACHGESGAGDGVFSHEEYSEMGAEHSAPSGHEIVQASDFTNPTHMLSASPALLQGKLIRGGMGTGMPMWGVIFTEEQSWSLVSYLYTFQFEEVR